MSAQEPPEEPGPGATGPTALAERYGTARPWRRPLVVGLSVLLAVVALGWLAWTAVVHSRPAVDSALVSFEVVDDHRTDAVLEVRLRADDVEASCRLRALAEDKTIVGEVSFAPDGEGNHDVEIRTERRATSVEAIGCTAPGQDRPR